MENIARIPPNDNEAEQAVLSCMLFDRDAVTIAYEMLKGEDFYRPSNEVIFTSIMELFLNDQPIDIVTVKNRLSEKDALDRVGGLEYLSQLSTGYFTSAHIRHYAKIVEQKSVLRKLIKASATISNSSYEGKEKVDSIIESAEKLIFDVSKNRNSRDIYHVSDILVETLNKVEEVYKTKGKISGIETGFIDFDHMTAGLQPSDLVLIAARPSMGKTAFALNIASYVSINRGRPTVIFSLEMSKEQLVSRMFCAQAKVDAQKLRNGELYDDDWDKLIDAIEPFSKSNLFIDDTPGISVADIRAKCRKLKLEKGIDLILIDYLQLMTGSSKTESRQQEISEISRSLKALAREMNAPVIALSQLSRACETRADHRPMLSDLRESGAIEQDADVVMFLYRDEYYHPDSEDKNKAELIIAKQRNGPTGKVVLTWLDKYTKFENAIYD